MLHVKLPHHRVDLYPSFVAVEGDEVELVEEGGGYFHSFFGEADGFGYLAEGVPFSVLSEEP